MLHPAYEEGVEQFLEFTSKRSRSDEDEKYFCPCINCLNGRRQVLNDIWEHLLCHGIKKYYKRENKKGILFILLIGKKIEFLFIK